MRSYLPLLLAITLSACASIPSSHEGDGRYFSQLPSAITPGIPFDSYQATDRYGREIHYYVSSASQKRLPLYLFIAGSGCESVFGKKADGTISTGYQGLLLRTLNGVGHIMVVEKPGVTLFDSTATPGTAVNCTIAFKEQHTLEGWSVALSAALDAATQLPRVDPRRVIVIGHSEGAISAAKLAASNAKVTHAALLSGSGASQLFDFIVNHASTDIEQTYKDFDFITSNAADTSRLFWGHPTKRWASFMAESSADLLMKTRAKIFLANGTLDKSVPIQSFDFLVTDLKRKGRAFDFDRIEGANHSLNLPTDSPGDGMRREFEKILNRWRE